MRNERATSDSVAWLAREATPNLDDAEDDAAQAIERSPDSDDDGIVEVDVKPVVKREAPHSDDRPAKRAKREDRFYVARLPELHLNRLEDLTLAPRELDVLMCASAIQARCPAVQCTCYQHARLLVQVRALLTCDPG